MVEKTLRRVRLIMLSLIATTIVFFNTDWVVAPFLARKFGHLQLGYRVAIVSVVSCVGASYIYWFGRLIDKIILEYKQNGRTEATLANSPYRWDRIKVWFIRRHKKVLHHENKWLRRIKRWGYPGAFLVGVIPEVLPGARTTLISFCGASNWRSGFAVYLIADFLKNIGLSTILGKLFHR